MLSACSAIRIGVDPTPTHPDTSHYFYSGKQYGTEVQFNPVTEILNEGFDQLRNDFADRRFLHQRGMQPGFHNVIEAVLHPDSAMKAYGYRKAFTDELLPLSGKSGGGGQWVPNYEFHLLGSGMVSRRMAEWYEAHGVAHPFALSVATMYTAHFINEALEDGGATTRAHPFDPVADLYVFDLGGILLFKSRRIDGFFSDKLEMTNWPVQATFSFPGFRLENAGQEYLLRAKLPHTDRFRGLFAFGIATYGGVSYGKRGGYALSLAAGAETILTPVIDTASGRKTVVLVPNAGVFFDHDGSLLFSLTAKHSKETIATANLYPGFVHIGSFTFGLWTAALKNGTWRVGITSPLGIGLGYR